jgi:hypothetical protein
VRKDSGGKKKATSSRTHLLDTTPCHHSHFPGCKKRARGRRKPPAREAHCRAAGVVAGIHLLDITPCRRPTQTSTSQSAKRRRGEEESFLEVSLFLEPQSAKRERGEEESLLEESLFLEPQSAKRERGGEVGVEGKLPVLVLVGLKERGWMALL